MSGARLLGPGDPPPFQLQNPSGVARALVVCDHASRAVPERLNGLGLHPLLLERHIAWDIGAADLAADLARRLDACVILAGYSRLVVDCNRALDDPTAFAALSDGTAVPGNHELDDERKALRAREIYWPYHAALEQALDRFRLDGITPALIAIHSFTPFIDEQSRPWEIGILWDVDPRIPEPLIDKLGARGVIVGDNEPYSGHHPADFTIDHHGEEAGLPCVSVEVRQDLIDTPAGVHRWGGVLAEALAEILANPALYRPRERESCV